MSNSISDLPFMKHVQPEPNSGCWIWTASCDRSGYAHRRHNQKLLIVHRDLYQLTKAPIPKGMQLDHLCRVRCCVNPDHLEIVTQTENNRRGATNGGRLAPSTRRKNKGRTLLASVRSTQRQYGSRKFQRSSKQTSLL